jgi:hypothetical protein
MIKIHSLRHIRNEALSEVARYVVSGVVRRNLIEKTIGSRRHNALMTIHDSIRL